MGFKQVLSKIKNGLKTAVKTNSISKAVKGIGGIVEGMENFASGMMNTDRIFTLGDGEEVNMEEGATVIRKDIEKLIDEANDKKPNFGNLVVKVSKAIVSVINQAVGSFDSSNVEIKEVRNESDVNVEGLENAIILQTPSKFNKQVVEDDYAQQGVALAQDVDVNLVGDPDSKITLCQSNIPKNSKNFLEKEAYQKAENIVSLSNQTPSYTFSTSLDGEVVKTENTLELYKNLRLLYDFNEEKFKKFLNAIALIWGYTKGYKYGEDPDLIHVEGYEKDNEIDKLQNAEELNENSLEFKQDVENSIKYGTLVFKSDSKYGYEMPTRFVCPRNPIVCKFLGNCKSMSCRTSTVGVTAKSNERLELEELPKVETHHYSFSFVHKNVLLNLGKLFIKEDKSFNEELLKTVHQHRSFNRLVSVYKNGKLSRFVKKEEIETLKEEEEYEECKTALFLL